MDNLSQVFSKQSHDCILHSDQGFQYTSRIYKDTLESLGITISHSRKGNCYDNPCCENFFPISNLNYSISGMPNQRKN